jgi:antitoxin component of MazEF toxin-antitoxin module
VTNSWEVILEEDEYGDVILPFPDELIKRYGWLEGDEIEFEIKDGAAIITNISAKKREQENAG